jgi:transcriptional regulator NrdR family protein
MKCAKCGKQTEVVKVYQFPTETRRRRECLTCGFRFTTSEKLWRKVYADEIRNKPLPKSVRKHVQEERPKRTYSNFDVVAVEGYDMDYEDMRTYVHVSDD